MKSQYWGVLLFAGIALYGLTILAIRFAHWWAGGLNHEVQYATSVQGRVSQRFENRGSVTIHLDENNLETYYFFNFRPAHAPLPHVVLDTAQQGELDRRGLMQLLQEGDSLFKAANDSLLVVSRSGRRTYWVCPPPTTLSP